MAVVEPEAGKLDLFLEKGTTFDKYLVCYSLTPNRVRKVVPLDGYTAQMTIRESSAENAAVLHDQALPIVAELGRIRITVLADISSGWSFSAGHVEVELYGPDNFTKKLTSGQFKAISEGVQ